MDVLAQADGPVVLSEMIFQTAPFKECHASTIVQTRDRGLVVAWFGGEQEGDPSVGIWLSRQVNGKWTLPSEIARGDARAVDGRASRFPCWNPVLFEPRDGPLLLFYKVGPSPAKWWGMLMTSADGGRSWTAPGRLPEGILGPAKNKPVQLKSGALLCPSSTEDNGWRVHIETAVDLGKTWTKSESLNDGKRIGAIQPTILRHTDGTLQVLCRTRNGFIAQSWSSDEGRTWRELALTDLPNPNSGIDALSLADGRQLLVYNPTAHGRTPLAIALSKDGRTWTPAIKLEDGPGEYSYPAVIQTTDRLVHVTYTHQRKHIKHVVLDPKALRL